MAVAFVSGAQTDPGSGYAPASGTDTGLVWVVGSRRNNENTASAQQFGATAMVEAHDESNNIAGGADPAAFLAHLVNPGTTSQTLTCTWDVAAPLSEAGYAFTLSGVDQTTPVYPTNGSITADYTGTDAPSLNYDAPAGSLVVYWRLHAQTTEPSWTDPTNFTARFTNNILASTAYRTLRIWTREVASAETGSSVAATSDAVGDGGIHGVIVFQPSAGGSASLDSVDDPIAFGDSINFTTSNMGPITSRTLSDGTNIITLSGTNTAASLGGLDDQVNRVLTGTVTFEVSDGTDTVNQTITLNPPANYSSVKLTAGFDTGPMSFLNNFGGTPAIGDEFIYRTSEVTLNADGSWETPGSGLTTIYGIDATDGFMESFTLETGEQTVTSQIGSIPIDGDNISGESV